MKRKLTITVDGELLSRATLYARSRGVSLSSLIEASLRQLAGEDTPSFASRWRGRFVAAHRNGGRIRGARPQVPLMRASMSRLRYRACTGSSLRTQPSAFVSR